MYLRKYSLSKKFPVFEMSHMKWPLYEISYICEIFSIKCPSAPKKRSLRNYELFKDKNAIWDIRNRPAPTLTVASARQESNLLLKTSSDFDAIFLMKKNKYEIKNCQGKINWFRISFTVTLKKTPNNEDCAKCQIMPRWTLLKQDWFIDCTVILKHYSHF